MTTQELRAEIVSTSLCNHDRRGYMAVNRGSTITTLDVTCLDCRRTVRAEGRGTPGIELEERIMAEATF